MNGAAGPGRVRRAVDWCFLSRETGRITIGQFPNAPLLLFMAASALDWAVQPVGTTGTVVRAVALGSLIAWAADELVRGVNPWRRLLGFGVLVYEAVAHGSGG